MPTRPTAIEQPVPSPRGAVSAQLEAVARRVFWWLTPEAALADSIRFAAQVMTVGTWEDVRTARAALGEETLRRALAEAPPGVFDARSWNYWHNHFGIAPVPPLPRRHLP